MELRDTHVKSVIRFRIDRIPFVIYGSPSIKLSKKSNKTNLPNECTEYNTAI